MAVDKKGTKQVAANKKAWHDYFVEEKYEAGIELAGTEVKSIRQGLQKLSCKAGDRSVQGQKAARQARQHRSTRCKTRDRPRDERA